MDMHLVGCQVKKGEENDTTHAFCHFIYTGNSKGSREAKKSLISQLENNR